ncbi:hypothetical protein EJ08DRAFT_306237 [Tothia fuscella]|uniref:Uncharacterized protein n=1 Tax=Tothia fuscella TaxID=1048955 RepID=A0A9P4NP54_9PEZI|nr:hypothetical protein EJ08DRAFT_306237 [Tothia fuscella]
MNCFSTLLVLTLLFQRTPAMPAPVPAPSQADFSTRHEDIMKSCTLFDPPNRDSSLAQCKFICGESVAKAQAADQISSISCISIGEPKWDKQNGIKAAIANCSCNNPLINELATDFVSALPALAEIGCNIIMSSINLVINLGALAIPGVGAAVDGGMIAGIQAAKMAAYAYDAGQLGADAFSNWMSPCGTSHLPDELKTAFDTFNAVNSLVIPGGFKAPKNVPKGSGKAGDKGTPSSKPAEKQPDPSPEKKQPDPSPEKKQPDPSPETKQPDPTPEKTEQPKTEDQKTATSKTEAEKTGPAATSLRQSDSPDSSKQSENGPSSTPASNPPSPTSESAQASSAEQSSDGEACTALEKRAGPGSKKCKKKDKELHITQVTNSASDIKTITKTCNGSKYPQACYHYYSAIQNNAFAKATFTCSDSNTRSEGVATSTWKKEHAVGSGWKKYTKDYKFWKAASSTTARCEADEWPPAYFMPEDSVIQERPQVIRWLPGSENGGVASQWRGFCDQNDGGAGNGQFLQTGRNKGDLNEKLVDLIKPGNEITQKGVNGKTTTTTQFAAKYTRAVYVLAFDNSWPQMPSQGNDWGLRDNACWPEDLVPNDPGFVLLNDDNWYTTAGSHIPDAQKQEYAKAPDQQRRLDADTRIKNRSQTPPTRRSFRILEDGFAVANGNSSRRLTVEEIEREIEITPCVDVTCSEERNEIKNGHAAIIIPRNPKPSATRAPGNIDAVATASAEPKTTQLISLKRSAVSAALPAVTAFSIDKIANFL